ncbi:NigD-like protein [Phocaeicola abscessus]|uniref:NigD-like protein n=1 Tax=Phocaeicola abscessus TaxID=555313 RepID=UPI000A01ED1E|nr:NigD-like protein [Phocaeicola abscessus]
MKRSFLNLCGLALLTCTFSLPSCNDDNNNDLYYPSALVTVKPSIDNSSFYLQLDDNTTLAPTNMKVSPFGKKEVRALVNYTLDDQAETSPHSRAVRINWIDSILTKPLAANLGNMNEKTYGDDPVEIINDWVTIAEDGYLTLRFRTRWGYGVKHTINLVPSAEKEQPYKVRLYHNAKSDLAGRIGDALVAFRIKSTATQTENSSDTENIVDLILEWKSYSGIKTATFKYRVPKEPVTGITEGSFVKMLD